MCWKSRHMRLTMFALAILALSGGTLTVRLLRVGAQSDINTNYVSSWIGNSGGVGNTDGNVPSDYIQMSIGGFAVQPKTGNWIGSVNWDEGGHEVGIYDASGKAIGAAHASHGGTGFTVTANSNYIYYVVRPGDGADILRVSGESTYQANLRQEDKEIKATSANYNIRSDLFGMLEQAWPMSNTDQDTARLGFGITGMASTDTHVYASDYTNSQIIVYDTNLNQLATYPFTRPAALTLAPDGTIWVVQGGSNQNNPLIVQLDNAGHPTGKQITGVVDPRGLAFLANGTLLVAENGPRQQILYYAVSDTPTIIDTLGQQGGIDNGITGELQANITEGSNATHGLTAPTKFHDLVGVATDASDNIYVGVNGGGTDMKKFSSSKTMLWNKVGLEFVDNASVDPASDGRDIYTKEEHYHMDYSKPVGQQWSYVGYTFDPRKYPGDPRLHSSLDGTQVRIIQGHKFLYLFNMYHTTVQIYRFDATNDGEVAIPSGMMQSEGSTNANDYPPGHPTTSNQWIWRDINGNGTPDAGEYQEVNHYNYEGGWYVDTNGGIWKTIRQGAPNTGIVYYPVQGIDEHGNPIYTEETAQKITSLADFSDNHQIYYDTTNDALYMSGYTHAHPSPNDDATGVGSEIIRYSSWSKGNRTPDWHINLPLDNKGMSSTSSFTVAGDYVFVATDTGDQTLVYTISNGTQVTTFVPGPSLGGNPTSNFEPTGHVDIPQGVTAFQRTDGSYIILVEDDGYSKTLMYLWNPTESTPTSTHMTTPTPTPQPLSTLPANWQNQDIGLVGEAGSATYNNGNFIVSGSGNDIWNSSDAFQNVYQSINGNATIVARVVSQVNTDQWAKAGVMFRSNLKTDATYADTIITPERNIDFQWRSKKNTISNWTMGPAGSAPYWVKLTRSGNTFTSYASLDGTTWVKIGSQKIAMAASIYVGLVVTAHNNSSISTATFDNVSITIGS